MFHYRKFKKYLEKKKTRKRFHNPATQRKSILTPWCNYVGTVYKIHVCKE